MKKLMVVVIALMFLDSSSAVAARKKHSKTTKGLSREEQYQRVLALCRQKFGGQAPMLHAEQRDGGWWCVDN